MDGIAGPEWETVECSTPLGKGVVSGKKVVSLYCDSVMLTELILNNRHELKVNNKPWREYLKTDSYKDQIPIFKGLLGQIGEQHEWTVADAKARFSNPLLDYIIFEE